MDTPEQKVETILFKMDIGSMTPEQWLYFRTVMVASFLTAGAACLAESQTALSYVIAGVCILTAVVGILSTPVTAGE